MIREQKVLKISDKTSRTLSFENLLFREEIDIFYTEKPEEGEKGSVESDTNLCSGNPSNLCKEPKNNISLNQG